MARFAARIMAGEKIADMGIPAEPVVAGVAVKEAVFPFDRFEVDVLLGPEMRSTGEVMGFDESFGMAIAKAQASAGPLLPVRGGTLVVTVNDRDKPTITPIARRFHEMGFEILATVGTATYLKGRGVPARVVKKIHEGRPHCGDSVISGDVDLLINTPLGKLTQRDDYQLRRTALQRGLPYTTTISAASAACDAILALKSREGRVKSLQEWHSWREAVALEAEPQQVDATSATP